MRDVVRAVKPIIVAGVLAVLLGGCPNQDPYEYVTGSQGNVAQIGTPQVEVLTPASNLSLTGGSQVDVNWQAQAGTSFATVDVFIDQDRVVDSGNELFAYRDLPLDQTSALVDTTTLRQGTYFIGVRVRQAGQLVASGYAPGSVTIDQRPVLYFEETERSFNDPNVYSARDNVKFDRSQRIVETFDVAWQLIDPDTPNSQVTINLDPDGTPNGNEIELYATSLPAQRAAQALTPPVNLFAFSFDLATYTLEAGTYKILALVTDPTTGNVAPFYAPGSIRLRGRLAGFVDLRDLDQPGATAVSGAIFEGFNPHDNAGSFVSSAADIDGDGFADFLMMSQFGKPWYQVNLERTGSGEAYMIYGRQQRFSGVNNLNSTGVLFRAEIFLGPPEVDDPVRPSRGVTSFTVLDDWDNDGVREFAFGVPFVDSDLRDFEILTSDVVNTYTDNLGSFRTGAVVVGAGASLRPTLGYPGRHVYPLAAYGQRPHGPRVDPECPEFFYGPNALDLGGNPYWRHRADTTSDLELNQSGCRIYTNDFGDQCGETIDQYADRGILISVPNRDPVTCTGLGRSVPGAGVVSLYFGRYIWNVDDLSLPHQGPYRYVLDDRRLFPVGGPGGTILREGSPGYYVDDDDSPNPCTLTISLLTPLRVATSRIFGEIEGGAVGNAYSAGDFNADGIPDFLVGSPLSKDSAGACFIVLGRLPELVVGNDLSVEELGLPMSGPRPVDQRVFDGIRVVGGVGERLGQAQADAGDFNNDGISDVIIGSPLTSARRGGAAVFFGSRTVTNLTQEEIAFDQIATRELGVVFVGEEDGDLAGARVANAGDVDGDGNTDILIAAPERSVRLDDNGDGFPEIERTRCGVVYLVYGSPDLRGQLNLADVGTEKLPGAVFIGRDSDHYLGAGLGEQGDRANGIAGAGDVDGDGAGDLLLGSVKASPRDRNRAGEVYLLYGAAN